MWRGVVDAAFNGLVLFDPARLEEAFARRLVEGENVFQRLTTTEMGEKVLRRGAIVPVLAIDSAGYDVVVRRDREQSPLRGLSGYREIARSDIFCLDVKQRAVVADLAVLAHWTSELGWHEVDLKIGVYEVHVVGFRVDEPVRGHLAGYEFVCTPTMGGVRGDPDVSRDMQVLRSDT